MSVRDSLFPANGTSDFVIGGCGPGLENGGGGHPSSAGLHLFICLLLAGCLTMSKPNFNKALSLLTAPIG